MTGLDLETGIDLRAERLGNAKNDAAGQRSPDIAQSADDDRLEAEGGPASDIAADQSVSVAAKNKMDRTGQLTDDKSRAQLSFLRRAP